MPLVVNLQQVVAATKGVVTWLNLGCGHILLDGCINVDMRNVPGVDVVAEAAIYLLCRDQSERSF